MKTQVVYFFLQIQKQQTKQTTYQTENTKNYTIYNLRIYYPQDIRCRSTREKLGTS